MRNTDLNNRAYVVPESDGTFNVRIQHPNGGYLHITYVGGEGIANLIAKQINNTIDRAQKEIIKLIKRKQVEAADTAQQASEEHRQYAWGVADALTDLLDSIEARKS